MVRRTRGSSLRSPRQVLARFTECHVRGNSGVAAAVFTILTTVIFVVLLLIPIVTTTRDRSAGTEIAGFCGTVLAAALNVYLALGLRMPSFASGRRGVPFIITPLSGFLVRLILLPMKWHVRLRLPRHQSLVEPWPGELKLIVVLFRSTRCLVPVTSDTCPR
jgi:hypothetical protein